MKVRPETVRKDTFQIPVNMCLSQLVVYSTARQDTDRLINEKELYINPVKRHLQNSLRVRKRNRVHTSSVLLEKFIE